jgi:hypothetical protein
VTWLCPTPLHSPPLHGATAAGPQWSRAALLPVLSAAAACALPRCGFAPPAEAAEACGGGMALPLEALCAGVGPVVSEAAEQLVPQGAAAVLAGRCGVWEGPQAEVRIRIRVRAG